MNSSPEEALFGLLLQKPPGKRAAFLDVVCEGDSASRQRLEALLAAHDQGNPALDDVRAGAAPAVKATVKIELADAPDEAVGQVIGRYKVLQKIGEGGCGAVYMAEQEQPVRRRVALKVIKLGMDTKAVVARFEAERQALALMDHPNIAKVLDAGSTETGRPYFVMELARGIKFTDYCDQNKLPTRERIDLFIKICQAIQHAHQKGIIHRDIKPSNILVTLHDGVPIPKVIDFGIAKATTDQRLTDKTLFTAYEQFIGTPAYMSPEQAEMSGLDIDTRSDIYSLGVLLYELLTGRTPFDPKELMESGIDAMRKTIREKDPVRPSTKVATLQGDELTTTAARRAAEAPKLVSLLRGDLDWIVMKCLEKDLTRRYETANGLAFDLKRHLNNEPVLARPASAAYKFQKAFRRNKLTFAAGMAVAMALILGIVSTTIGLLQARQSAALALRSRSEAERLSNFVLDDFYDELAPSGRYETLARLLKEAVAYYDSLPPSLRTSDTLRSRAAALARLAWVEVQQADFKTALANADEAISRLEAMRRKGDQSEGTACSLATALEAQGYYQLYWADRRLAAGHFERSADVLRPFALSSKGSRQAQLVYADVLNYLCHVQEVEQAVTTCNEALRVVEGLGALGLSDLDAASAWADIADSEARRMLEDSRLDEAERLERQGLKVAEGVLERRPSDLRARRDLYFAPNLFCLLETMRFHDAAALDWAGKMLRGAEDSTHFDPSQAEGWPRLTYAKGSVSALLFRAGQVTPALEAARSGAEVERSHHGHEGVAGGLWCLIAMEEAQRGNRSAAEAALQQARIAQEAFIISVAMPEPTRISFNEPIRDAERQMRQAFGEDGLVLDMAKEALVRIEAQVVKTASNLQLASLVNQWKRRALSDAARAALSLDRSSEAERSARALLDLPILHGETVEWVLTFAPDDLGWARVLLAQAQLEQAKPADALQTLGPALELYRAMQVQGVTHLVFRQRFARALCAQAQAQPATTEGLSQRRSALSQAAKLLGGLSNEAKQLHDSKELFAWIAQEQNKSGPPQP